jgi:hypothetical protein
MERETLKEAARRLAEPALRNGFKPVAIHEYADADGSPLYARIRLRHPTWKKPDGKAEKWIRPMHLDGECYVMGEPTFPNGKPLYRLRALSEKPDAPVVVAEGENVVEALERLGVVATTSGSATSAGAANWGPLAGRRVTIWPDNDQPGRDYAEAVRRILLGLGASVTVIDAAALGLPDGGDAVDWLAERPNAAGRDIAALPRLGAVPIPKSALVADSAGWPDPQPLPNALPAVPPFDCALLPDALRPWIEDIAERVQCPPDFPAVGAMIALSAVVGRKIGIRPKRRDDWLEVPNLWGAIVGNPGVMKSPSLREAMRPLARLEARAAEAFADEVRDWQRQHELAKLQREANRANVRKELLKPGAQIKADALADPPEDDEPQARRYVVNDCSVEALGVILQHNPNGTLAYRDELIGLLKSLDREGNEGARGFFLTAWSGKDAYTFDRIGRGLNMRIEACCLALLGSIQPAVIGGYLRQAVADGGGDGLLSRFQLLTWPDVSTEWRNVDRWPETAARTAANETFDRLDALDPLTNGATVEDGGIPFLRFDDAAQELFTEWRTGIEQRIRLGEDHAAIESHLAKYRKLVPAMALLIHLADNGGPAIGETALLKSLAWAEYLEAHARRAYASVTQAEANGARALLRRIRKGDIADDAGRPLDVFAARDVYRRGWSHLGTPDAFYEAAKLLCDFDYLREEVAASGPKGGAPKQTYRVNPKASNA